MLWTKKGTRTIKKLTPRGFAFRSLRGDLGRAKGTRDLEDEKARYLEREATKRRDRLGTRLIYSLTFL